MNTFIVFLTTLLLLGATNGGLVDVSVDLGVNVNVPDFFHPNNIFRPASDYVSGALKKIAGGRIYQGSAVTASNQGILKHQVKLLTQRTDGWYGCGGSIISSRCILTAGHCVANGLQMQVYYGVLDQSLLGNALSQTVRPSNWVLHKQYNPTTVEHDIALVLLPNNIPFSPTIGPIALPGKAACTDWAGKGIMISGWGYVNNNNVSPDILQYSNVITDTPEGCEQIFGSFKRNTMVCADAGKAKTCQGDSGGPFTYYDKGVQKVIGLVSFGAVGCANNFNTVGTCVSAYLDWIQANGAGYL